MAYVDPTKEQLDISFIKRFKSEHFSTNLLKSPKFKQQHNTKDMTLGRGLKIVL